MKNKIVALIRDTCVFTPVTTPNLWQLNMTWRVSTLTMNQEEKRKLRIKIEDYFFDLFGNGIVVVIEERGSVQTGNAEFWIHVRDKRT